MPDNLALWNAVEQTDPKHTKSITGKAYNGNSPKPHYLIHKATETFGPCGIGWGFEIVKDEVLDGALLEPGFYERIHTAKVRVWYEWDGKRGSVEHVGQTAFCGKRRNGALYTDEDAPKKSVTDALVKALSMIGFAGDIFMGRFDDSKYVSDLNQELRAAEKNGKRTRADISANAKRKKEETSERIPQDLAQITSVAELERYKREVLTPDFMAGLSTAQFAVDEMVADRQKELEAGETTKADYIRECHDRIDAFKTAPELLTWWNSDDEKEARRGFELTKPEVQELMVRVFERRDALTKARDVKQLDPLEAG